MENIGKLIHLTDNLGNLGQKGLWMAMVHLGGDKELFMIFYAMQGNFGKL